MRRVKTLKEQDKIVVNSNMSLLVSLCLDVLVPQPITVSLLPSQSNRVEDDYRRQHRTTLSFSADEGRDTGCSTHTASSTGSVSTFTPNCL